MPKIGTHNRMYCTYICISEGVVMVKKKENVLRDSILDVKYWWEYGRKGLETPRAIFETIQNTFRGDYKPIIVKRQPIEGGWWFLINIPPGCCEYIEFKKKEKLFAESFGGQVEIEKKGKAVHLYAYEREFEKVYPYEKFVDPALFGNMLLPLHFGFTATGPLIKDLAKLEGILIGGNRGTGKSNLLITLVTNLLLHSNAQVAIIDYKRVDSLQFEPYTAYAKTPEMAAALMETLTRILFERIALFERYKANKLEKAIKKGLNVRPIVLVADELSEIVDTKTLDDINKCLRMGRFCGFYMIGATQRPSSTNVKNNWGDSKMLLPCRVCFSVPDEINSKIILDNTLGASLPIDIQGRAIFQYEKSIEVQTLLLEPEEAEELLAQQPIEEVIQFEQYTKRLPPRQTSPRNDREVRMLNEGTGRTATFFPFEKF